VSSQGQRSENIFKQWTGISVRIEQVNSCGMNNGGIEQTLRVLAEDVKLNRTPIQCEASPVMPGRESMYSKYSVMLIKGEHQSTCGKMHNTTTIIVHASVHIVNLHIIFLLQMIHQLMYLQQLTADKLN